MAMRPSQNNYLLDGIDNNSDTVDFLNGTNYVVLPPVDAIQEFKVQTSDFSAEFGRSGAAVLNATIKSGTNEFHGSGWEFFRNDKLDAADFFENAHQIKKGELRQNQFGATIGGPVVIPHVFNGSNKLFFFADYEGFRRVQGTVSSGTVPTLAERNSWNSTATMVDFSDLLTQSGSSTDILGRSFKTGQIFDPATTRPVECGVADPVTGLTVACTGTQTTGTAIGFVRDPFVGNLIPAGRLDANAIKLLNLYPLPTTSSLFSNFASSPKLFEHRNSFDTRMDYNLNEKNQIFFRFSYVDDPQFIPGIFGGIADGGAFQQGNQTALAQQSALGYTHTFSPTLINEVRAGFNYLHTTRSGPVSGQLGIPEQYGIQDIPQVAENGGLPAFGIGGLATLGSNAFLPSDEVTSTFQLTDDLTKIYGKHTFKMGIEWQHVKFSTLQPPWSHGEFDYSGAFTDIAGGSNSGSTGRADFLLTPIASTLPAADNGINYVGGSSNVYASNISLTDDGKSYYGGYVNDDWKVTSKLTVNLGVRYDFFGLVGEHHGEQANFVPSLFGVPTEIMPPGPLTTQLSTGTATSYTNLLAKDGIALLITDHYGAGLGHSQRANFAPRVGFAYQASPKLVVRGGIGLFYNGFENRGYSPNIGESYPYQFQFHYYPANDSTPTTIPGCAAPVITFEVGFSCTPLIPNQVNASGLALLGIQFDYKTPYSLSGNLTVQYSITPTLALQVGYVTSQGRHLEVFPGSNEPSTIAYHNTAENTLVPYPDFGTGASYAATEGNSIYNGLQTKLEKRFASGLNFLATYTYSQVPADAHDLLNGGSVNGYRAPYVPGFGIHADYALAPFDIRNVFHFSGGYELPFGHGKKFASGATGWQNQAIGGWSVNWSTTLQGGQPIQIGCPTGTVEGGLNCGALHIAGQSVKIGTAYRYEWPTELVRKRPTSAYPALPDRINGTAHARHASGMRAVDGCWGAGWDSSIARARIPQTGHVHLQGLPDQGTHETTVPRGNL